MLTGDLADLVADDVAEQNESRFGQAFGSITDIQIGPEGAVYVTSIADGTLYRIVPEPTFAWMMLAGSAAVAFGRRVRDDPSR